MKKSFIRWTVLNLLILLNVFICFSQAETGQKVKLHLTEWLKIGPMEMPMPVFTMGEEQTFTTKDLLEYQYADHQEWWPEANSFLNWSSQIKLKWEPIDMDTAGYSLSIIKDKNIARLAYLATYIDATRWTNATLKIKSSHIFEIYLDGEKIGSKTQISPEESKNYLENQIKLETGKHLLLLKLLYDPDKSSDWNIQSMVEYAEIYGQNAISHTISPTHLMNVDHLLTEPTPTDVTISPNGELMSVTIERALPPTDDTETWLELRGVAKGNLIQTYRGGMNLEQLKWASDGKQFAYTTTEDEKTTLWIVHLNNGTNTPLLENVKNFDEYSWSPDGSYIVYTITEESDEEEKKLKRLESLRYRRPWWGNKAYLFQVNVPEGIRRRLTDGPIATDLAGISPDGNRLLITREIEDYSERPFAKTEVYVLDLKQFVLDSLWTGKWFDDARWSPDGKKILFLGGPSMFGDIGQNVSQGKIPNDYDGQAYLMDLTTKKISPLTKDFPPSINNARWYNEISLYFTTIDGAYQNVYRYSLKSKKFKRLDTGAEVVSGFEVARNKPVAVYTGSSAATPKKAYRLNLTNNKYQALSFPAEKAFENVQFGDVESWHFKNDRGDVIEGRVYYPPNFKPNKQYPAIVYYYGGTSPVTRDFGGRYPKNLWAAQGYVVYVLQPSGAVGFGQEFSAYHVNDWGKIVADEIVIGVKKFLIAHPFVDRNRIGCIGASYGGFMTMLLLTQTDVFTAGVSHAGISSISSYWGEGFWGYQYSAVATANSFPWNNKELYIEQSPLFSADKINTPLLLLHGTSDTNVPPGESIQLFTALKLLQKPVEFVQVEGANHWVMKYSKRELWSKTIISWFDKWLKDQPQWWNDLYIRN